MSAGERRRHVRIGTDIACIVDGVTQARIQNLSLGGALLLGPVGLAEIDDTVTLEFQAGGVEPVTIFGEVVRMAVCGVDAEYGIQSVAVEPDQLEKLGQCVDRLGLDAIVGGGTL